MTMGRAFRITLLAVLLLLVAAGVWWWKRTPIQDSLEQWCATQLRRIAGDLLAPTLEFSSLQLELPATATLNDVLLTSDGEAIIAMTSMRLEFRDMPRRGQPLIIRSDGAPDRSPRRHAPGVRGVHQVDRGEDVRGRGLFEAERLSRDQEDRDPRRHARVVSGWS
jgi:hypothetical protein